MTGKFDKANSAGYLANHMARLFAAGLRERITPLGLAVGQFPVMLELQAKDGLTQKELVGRLDIEQATMANTLTRMERDGLIRRLPHPDDGRAQIIRLTDHGRALYGPAIEAAKAQNALALSGLNDDEKVLFLELMQRVVAAMKSAEKGGDGV